MAGTHEGTAAEELQQQHPEGGGDATDEEAELAKLEAELYGGGADGDAEVVSEDQGAGTAQEGDEAPVVPLSKNQMKKKARLERLVAKRVEQRQREKAVKAQRRAEATERKAAELAVMTEEEKAAMRLEKQAKLEALREQERQLKERLKKSLEVGPHVVIDLDWESRMTESDVRHLIQQLGFSYAVNKQVERPVHMVLSSFKGGVAATANKMITGMDKWCVTRTDQHYTDYYGSPEDKARLVYLTADAQDELGDLDDTKIYVIGGLVDHNRYKGLCEEQARAAGIATARLPISRHIQLASRAVLTVNHVFQIMVEYYARRDWASVLDHVLPMRKRAEFAQQGAKGQGGKGQGAKGGEAQGAKGGQAASEAATPAAAEDGAAAGKADEEAVAAAAEEGGAEGAAEGEVGDAEVGDAEWEVGDAEVGDAEGRGTKRKAEGELAEAE